MSQFQHQHLNTTQNTGNILQGMKANSNKVKTISIGQEASTINNFDNGQRVQKDVQNADNDKRYVDQGVNANVDQEKTCVCSSFNLSKKAKIISIVIISILVVLSIGLFIGLKIGLKPKIRSVKTSKLVRLGNGILKITGAELEYNRYKGQPDKIPVHITEYEQKVGRRMLQSNQPSKFYCSSNLKDEGIIIRVCENGTVALNVDRQQFTNYLNAQNSRILQQQADQSSAQNWINIENQLYRTLNSAFYPNKSPSQFHTQTFISYTYSKQQNKFILQHQQQPQNKTRLLVQNRQLFKVKRNTRISELVANKINPIVNTLKNSIPLLKSVQPKATNYVGADILLKKSGGGDKGVQGVVENCFVKDQELFVCNSGDVEMGGAKGNRAIVIEFDQK